MQCKVLDHIAFDEASNILILTLVSVLLPVFNKSFAAGLWQHVWKLETQKVTPKVRNPTSFDKLRNFSCTNLFSKLMEVFLLKRLTSEVSTNQNPYGGIMGSGTNHFLINTYHNIMTALEDPRNAVSIISVDFSKAFNCIDYCQCLRAFAYKGASCESLTMIAVFLRGREMSIKVFFPTKSSLWWFSTGEKKLATFCLP